MFVAVTQHPATASAGIAPHFGQLEATQVLPPLLDPPELDDDDGWHVPALHAAPVSVPPNVQSLHETPPVPHTAGSVPTWHVPLLSQQPLAQLVESHAAAPLLLVLVPLEPPPSSPLLLLVLDVVPPDEL